MQDKQKAHQYFDQSISVKKPSKEALLSYAAFNEEQHEYNGALKIL
jgi:type IV pilus assembly protein PilQ